jgi:hypothetical protein
MFFVVAGTEKFAYPAAAPAAPRPGEPSHSRRADYHHLSTGSGLNG